MSAERRKRRKPATLQVDVHNASELRNWARYWHCTQRDVRDAVKVSGVMAVDVGDWLKVNVVR